MRDEQRQPFVSIILVNYNGAKDTLECVESLKQQNYRNYEIVVVDNCSTDDSVEVLSTHKDNFVFIVSEENRGFSAGNNIGISEAIKHNADYVLLLNNDTIVTPDFLTKMMYFAERESKNVIYTGTIYYEKVRNRVWYAGGSFNKWTARTTHWHIEEENVILPQKPIEVSFVSGCEMLIPIEVINEIGVLNEDYFLYSEDVDYCIRVINHGYKLIYVPESVIYHKVSASTSKISNTSQYYSARNRRILIFRNLDILHGITAIGFTHLQTIRRLLQGRMKINHVVFGILDYYKKSFGKCKRKL